MALVIKIPEDTRLFQQIRKDLDNDPFAKDIKHHLQQANANKDFEESDGLVYFKGLLYIPSGRPARKHCKVDMICQPWDILESINHRARVERFLVASNVETRK